MTSDSRVAWREGLFLRPQHFQQQDRHADAVLRARTQSLRPYPWGLTDLKVNSDLCSQGKFGLLRASGVFRDGAPFEIPADTPTPPSLVIPPDTRDAIIYLTLPDRTSGGGFARADDLRADTRYAVVDEDVFDAFAPDRISEDIEVARLNIQLGITPDHLSGRTLLAVARVREVLNGMVILDDSYIPPCLDIRATRLAGFLTDLLGRATTQIDTLSLRAVQTTEGGSDGIRGILLLQSINRCASVLTHLGALPNVHPERLYESLAAMAGDLSTFLPERRCPRLEPYDHEHLNPSFDGLFKLLQELLSIVPNPGAHMLDLRLIETGYYAAVITDHASFSRDAFYLAVSAKGPVDDIRRLAPGTLKIGSIHRMREIIQNALLGVRLSAVPTPPSQINILPGYVYFQLDDTSAEWREFETAPGLGLHVSGAWADLKLELWCVKRTGR